jgi:hypothetical protein
MISNSRIKNKILKIKKLLAAGTLFFKEFVNPHSKGEFKLEDEEDLSFCDASLLIIMRMSAIIIIVVAVIFFISLFSY